MASQPSGSTPGLYHNSIIITLFIVGAKHSYVTVKYNEANLSQLLKPTCKTTKPGHNKFNKTISRTEENM